MVLFQEESRLVKQPLRTDYEVKPRLIDGHAIDDSSCSVPAEDVVTILPGILRHSKGYLAWAEKQRQVKEASETLLDYDGKPRGSLIDHIFRFWRPAAQKAKPDIAESLVSQIKDFFNLLENNYIKAFLVDYDKCNMYADRYLLAMVFTYFARAGYQTRDYTPYNFFAALMLAHDVEEDLEDMKLEFLPWALGVNWRNEKHILFDSRDMLFKRIEYRALVSRRCCEALMQECPDHWAWQRRRNPHHGGIDREFVEHIWSQADEYFLEKWCPRGPWYPPRICDPCTELKLNQELAKKQKENIGKRLSLKKRQHEEDPNNEESSAKKICKSMYLF